MRIGAAISTDPDPVTAARTAATEAISALEGAEASLAVLFASRHHGEAAAEVLRAVREAAGPDRLIGCVAESVIGGAREVEEEPAVSVWLATLPAPAETFSMGFVPTSEGGVFTGSGLADVEGDPLVLLADPFTFPVDVLLEGLNERWPGAVVMGGLASGGTGPGETRLYLDDEVLETGAVVARLRGVRVHPLVSQGCRPVGDVYTVTKVEGNVILELAGRPALERLREVAAALEPDERQLLASGLQVGRAIDEYKAEPGRGDYLVRGVLGADPGSGAIAIADRVELGATVRFHVRDAASADEDLRAALARERGELAGRRPAGALLFTCNGRGSRMFLEPDHDARLFAERLGGVPTVGFFCAGEVGPVGGRNFLHGFTASAAILEDG